MNENKKKRHKFDWFKFRANEANKEVAVSVYLHFRLLSKFATGLLYESQLLQQVLNEFKPFF